MRTVTLVTNFQKPTWSWEVNHLKLNTSKGKMFVIFRYKNKITQNGIYVLNIFLGDKQDVKQDAILKFLWTFQNIIA